jgi:hypothetical protein
MVSTLSELTMISKIVLEGTVLDSAELDNNTPGLNYNDLQLFLVEPLRPSLETE